jgi:hypothetical protein
VVVVLVAVVVVTVVVSMVVVTVVVVDGEVLVQQLLEVLNLGQLAVVLVVVVGMSVVAVVVVVVMVVVVVLAVVVLVVVVREESLDLIDQALVDQKLEGLPLLVVVDVADQSVVKVLLDLDLQFLTLQLTLKLVEELVGVVAVVVVVAMVSVVVVVSMGVEVVVSVVMTVVVTMVVVDSRKISFDFSHLGNSDVGLVGVMTVVMGMVVVVMGMNRNIISIVTEVGVVEVGLVIEFRAVGGSGNQGGGEAEEGNGDDLGLHFDSRVACLVEVVKRVEDDGTWRNDVCGCV